MASTGVRSAGERGAGEQIERCLAGDAAAWEELVVEHHRRIYYHCLRFTGSRAEAEDLTQDVFLKVFCNLGRFDAERGNLSAWIQNMTRNHLIDQFRRTRVVRASGSLDVGFDGDGEGVTLAERLPDGRPSQEEYVSRGEVRSRVHAALHQLSAYNRDAIVLCDLEERDYKEAARILCVPEGTVKSRLSRGRAELARLLDPARTRVRESAKARLPVELGLGVGVLQAC